MKHLFFLASFQDITTFAVYVTAFDFKKSFTFIKICKSTAMCTFWLMPVRYLEAVV